MALTLKGLDGKRVSISSEMLEDFRAGFRGPVLCPEDALYDEVRKVWNAMVDRRPGLIARCTGTVDVVAALRFARQHRLLLSVRGGGHNIAGLAVCEGGLMIDMALLKGVWVDPVNRTARAQAGCTLGDVDRETQLYGMAAVLGFVSATGIAGLTVGGGFGYLTRLHGWTCDNLISMEVVTADGNVLRASATENEDLFWALRGGSGNFGIVISFEYRLHLHGPQILGGAIVWHGSDSLRVLEAYREFSTAAPREMASVAVLRTAPPAPWLPQEIHGEPIVAVFICHSGSLGDGDALLAPLRSVGRPVADVVRSRPYVQMQSLLDAQVPKGRRYYWKSHYLATLDQRVLEVAAEHAKRSASPHSAILLFQVQGAIGELPDGFSPMGNRDAAYVLNIAAGWEETADDVANVNWARECFDSTMPWSTGGVYVNFLTEEEGRERIEAAYGATNLERLARIKHMVDPDNLFRHTKQVT